jgi:protein subunit release factor B
LGRLVFPVTADKERALRERMAGLGIRDEDLEERFVRSGGKGGQNVNKVATCVVLRHVPSGFAVKCQETRTQAMNRFLARRLLLEKIEADRLGRASRREQEIERVRRQKRKRSKRAKEKMLEGKRAQSEKKAARRPIARDD